MDEAYELNGISFIWDPEKAQMNVDSHGITFEQAAETLKKRLDRDRPMTSITLRMPDDVIDDLKRIAPLLGFSGYQPLLRPQHPPAKQGLHIPPTIGDHIYIDMCVDNTVNNTVGLEENFAVLPYAQ